MIKIDLIPWYYKALGAGAILVIAFLLVDNHGFNRCEDKHEIAEGKQAKADLKKLKETQTELTNLKAKYDKLEVDYDASVKADNAYSCPVPNSLRATLNAI
jgi:hypothetical protein